MIRISQVLTFTFIILRAVYSQPVIGSSCISQSSGSPGVCKLLTNCDQARDDVIKHNRLPQTCGFQGTQAIVCCPQHAKRIPGEISKIKCRQYSSYAYEKVTGTSQTTKNECGHKIVKRIVGGETASRKEFPHMVIIGFEPKPDKIEWLCGGSLISDQYILTSAHCVNSITSGEAKHVKLGITSLSDTSKEHQQQFRIIERLSHPDYRPTSSYNDISLMKLDRPATLNSFSRPACLYTDLEIESEKPIATGWGYTSYANGEMSDKLLKVTLTFVDYDFCNTTYKNGGRRLKYGINSDTQICAGAGSEEKDTCGGDGGGPLQIYHSSDDISCMYDIVGIVSFGKSCGFGAPGVYTKVSHYVKWIEDVVWPEST